VRMMRTSVIEPDDESVDGEFVQEQVASREPEPQPGDIIHLLDVLEERIGTQRRVPFTRRLLISPEDFEELLDHMRHVSQGGVRQARSIVRLRDTLLAEAQRDAQLMLDEARMRCDALLSDEGLREAARHEGERIIAEAETRAERSANDADRYAAEVLVTLREKLLSVRQAISAENHISE